MVNRNIRQICNGSKDVATINDTNPTQSTKYTRRQFSIQGSRVTVSFPEKCADGGIMDVVRQILVYAYVNNELENGGMEGG